MPIPSGSFLDGNANFDFEPATTAALAQLRKEFAAEVARLETRLEQLEEQKPWKIEQRNSQLSQENEVNVAVNPNASTASSNTTHEKGTGFVHFGESAWSFPVVVGLAKAAGPWDIFFAIVLLLLNVGMQAMFSYIIIGEDFMGKDFGIELVKARQWRTSFAHDHKHLDLAGSSLVTRVCSGEGALILSTMQTSLIEDINSFLGLKQGQFQPGWFQPGVLLNLLCILLWSFCVFKELRSIWLLWEATNKLKRTRRTILQDNVFHGLSWARFRLLHLTLFLRFSVASVLLGAGIRWLARTTSITECMLNAVALNAILDVDEFLFAAFTPVAIQLAVQNLEPIKVKYTARRSQIESLVLCLLLSITIITSYFNLLRPLADTMVAVKQEFCFGNQTFVVSQNPNSGLVVGMATVAERTGQLSVVEQAVEYHKFSDASELPYLISFAAPGQFNKQVTDSMETQAQDLILCMETDFFTEGGQWYQDPLMASLILPQLRTAGRLVGHPSEDCASLAPFCNQREGRMVRMVCGDTCGCTQTNSSAWYKVPAEGCQNACLARAYAQLAHKPCRDQVDQAWFQFWDDYIDVSGAFVGQNLTASDMYPTILQLTQVLKATGCAGLYHPIIVGQWGATYFCAGDPERFRPLAWTCPETCGCLAASPPSYCPASCSNSTR
ncbi:unnamed protein product [Effrenium voratum]|nr:unnamed protein product [Effrenium voratum]